jgi:sigma-B regulation protein RsbU (phosphoserine phosphatase)
MALMATSSIDIQDRTLELERLRTRVQELEAWNRAAERAAEALVRSEDALRKIFDHSNDGILVVDPSSDRIVDVNHRACEMLGYEHAELLSMPLMGLYPDDPYQLQAFARQVLERGTGSTLEVECRTRTGERRATEISASVVQLSTGSYLIALLRDVTDRRAAEADLRRANTRMRADLEAAADMQRSLLPTAPPTIEGVRVAWAVETCERLGGDTLDVFALDAEHLGFYLIDVSGHGVKAAMLSVALHHALCPYPMPGALLVETARNRMFPMESDSGQYFTMVYGILDVPRRQLRFVSAGQGAPIHVPRGGEPEEIQRFDLPIGVLPDAIYRDHRVSLAPGSRLYFASDGVFEAVDAVGAEFGRERVLASLCRHRHRSLSGGAGELMREVRDFSGRGLRDDVSLLAVELA